LFNPDATQEDIFEFFDGANVDILLDLPSFSAGGIPGVVAKLNTACKIAYIGYPSLHYGIYDFTILQRNVLNPDCMQSNDRERIIITDGMYPPVGYHNGHHDTRKDWDGKLVVPEGRRPLLVFLGDGSKIREESFYAWLDILAGTGDGPDSALLMLLQSSEMVMREVEQWRKNYNRMREGPDVIMSGRIRWFSYRSTQELWGWCEIIRGRAIGVSCLGPYDKHTLVNDELWSGMCHLALRTPGQDWATLVAPTLVELAGLGDMFIANSVADYKTKGIMLALVSSQAFLVEASNHLLRCRKEKIGLFNLKQPVLNLERALYIGWTKFREAKGVRGEVCDVDLTKLYPVRETCLFSPQAAAAYSIKCCSSGGLLHSLLRPLISSATSIDRYRLLLNFN
jgi:predicted O-linked N-acetylglucosamine transferase (SPINDLY family)